MRYLLSAIIRVEDGDVDDLLMTARARAKVDGGSPEMITDVTAALVELFDLTDEEGKSTSTGLSLHSVDAEEISGFNNLCERGNHKGCVARGLTAEADGNTIPDCSCTCHQGAAEGEAKVQKSFTVIGVYPDDLDHEGPQGASFMENVKAVDVQHAIRLVEAMLPGDDARDAMIISVIEGWHTELEVER